MVRSGVTILLVIISLIVLMVWTARDSTITVTAMPAESGYDLVRVYSASLTSPPKDLGGWMSARSYVPAYAVIREGRGEIKLNATLSINNPSARTPLVIDRIDYLATSGQRLQAFVLSPIAIRPLATIQILVDGSGATGGGGANFIVDWATAASEAEPLIEVVMIASKGTGGYSFVSTARTTQREDDH